MVISVSLMSLFVIEVIHKRFAESASEIDLACKKSRLQETGQI